MAHLRVVPHRGVRIHGHVIAEDRSDADEGEWADHAPGPEAGVWRDVGGGMDEREEAGAPRGGRVAEPPPPRGVADAYDEPVLIAQGKVGEPSQDGRSQIKPCERVGPVVEKALEGETEVTQVLQDLPPEAACADDERGLRHEPDSLTWMRRTISARRS